MAKRLVPYPKDKFIKALKSKGFIENRVKGGHAIYERTTTQSVSTVSYTHLTLPTIYSV